MPLTSVTISQEGADLRVDWTDTGPEPSTAYSVARSVNDPGGPYSGGAAVAGNLRTYLHVEVFADMDAIEWSVVNQDNFDQLSSAPFAYSAGPPPISAEDVRVTTPINSTGDVVYTWTNLIPPVAGWIAQGRTNGGSWINIGFPGQNDVTIATSVASVLVIGVNFLEFRLFDVDTLETYQSEDSYTIDTNQRTFASPTYHQPVENRLGEYGISFEVAYTVILWDEVSPDATPFPGVTGSLRANEPTLVNANGNNPKAGSGEDDLAVWRGGHEWVLTQQEFEDLTTFDPQYDASFTGFVPQ